MTIDANAPTMAADFNHLAALKSRAAKQDPAALREAARHFEALFIQMMLQSMRDASVSDDEDELFDSKEGRMYWEMFDQNIAMEMTRERSIGLADMLMRQLGSVDQLPKPTPDTKSVLDVSDVSQSTPSVTPSNFVSSLWPHAQRVGEQLGVEPRFVLAQAALETGWGQHVMSKPDGSSSFNFFGIKANDGWDGDRVRHSTLEHENGLLERRNESFRAYGSIEEAFDDYARFIGDQPRYGEALAKANNGTDYANELQRAGYATDPDYGHKIREIAEGDRLRDVF